MDEPYKVLSAGILSKQCMAFNIFLSNFFYFIKLGHSLIKFLRQIVQAT